MIKYKKKKGRPPERFSGWLRNRAMSIEVTEYPPIKSCPAGWFGAEVKPLIEIKRGQMLQSPRGDATDSVAAVKELVRHLSGVHVVYWNASGERIDELTPASWEPEDIEEEA